jgi:hypothetical protein
MESLRSLGLSQIAYKSVDNGARIANEGYDCLAFIFRPVRQLHSAQTLAATDTARMPPDGQGPGGFQASSLERMI